MNYSNIMGKIPEDIRKPSNFFVLFSLFLTLLTTLLSKPAARIAVQIFFISSIYFLYLNFSEYKKIISNNKAFIKALGLFFILTTIIGIFHFGLNYKFLYQLKKLRWIPYLAVLPPTLVILISNLSLKSKHFLRYFIFTLSFALLLVSAEQLLHYFFNISTVDLKNLHEFPKRVSWTYNPNSFSRITLFFSCLLFYFTFFDKDKKYKFYFLSLSLSYFLLTLLSFSRAIWLGIIAGFLVLILKLINQKDKFSATVSLAILLLSTALLFSFDSLKKRVLLIFDSQSFSIQHRIELWKANISFVKENPLIGIGFNQNKDKDLLLEKFDPNFYEKYKHLGDFLFTTAHNKYLDIASSFGLPVLFIFIFIFGSVLLRLFNKNGNKSTQILYFISLFYLSAIAIALLFDGMGHDYWIVVILATTPFFISKERKEI